MLLLMLAEESVEVEGEDVAQSPPPAIHREQLGLLKHYPLKKVGDIVAQGHKKSSDFLTNPGNFHIFRGSHLERCRKQEEFLSQDEGNRG